MNPASNETASSVTDTQKAVDGAVALLRELGSKYDFDWTDRIKIERKIKGLQAARVGPSNLAGPRKLVLRTIIWAFKFWQRTFGQS